MCNEKTKTPRIDDGYGLTHPIHPDEIIVVHKCCGTKIRKGTAFICSMCRTPSESVEFRLTYGEYLRRFCFPDGD